MNLMPLLPPIFGHTASLSIVEFIAAQVTAGTDLPLGAEIETALIMPCC